MDPFAVLARIFSQVVIWMRGIHIFGTDLFTLFVGFMAVSFGVTAIRFLFGGDRGSGEVK